MDLNDLNDLTYKIRGAIFKVHTALGPGLLEGVYVTALTYELTQAVDALLDVHKKQLLTYLKLANKKLGILVNFNVASLKDKGEYY